MQNQLFTHIDSHTLITPDEIKITFNGFGRKNVWISRKEIEHILDGQDHRKFIVVGPVPYMTLKRRKSIQKDLKSFGRVKTAADYTLKNQEQPWDGKD